MSIAVRNDFFKHRKERLKLKEEELKKKYQLLLEKEADIREREAQLAIKKRNLEERELELESKIQNLHLAQDQDKENREFKKHLENPDRTVYMDLATPAVKTYKSPKNVFIDQSPGTPK